MALEKNQIKASYPLPVYNYRVTIDSETLGFSEVSGLGVRYDPVTYKHGLSFLLGAKIIPGMRQAITITLKKGVIQGGRFLSDWFKDAYANPFRAAKKDIVIDLCDETGTPVVRWHVKGALPVKLDAPAFDAESNSVAIETMELIAHDLLIDDSL